MIFMMNPDENRLENVDFLIKAASILPGGNYAQKLLKSHYLTKCKKLSQDHSHSKSFLSDEEMCRKCSTPWSDVNYSLSIAPIEATKRKSRKMHKQIDDKSKRKNHLAKKLSKKANNVVSVRCDLCKFKNKVVLWKKSSAEPKPKPDIVVDQKQSIEVPSKRPSEIIAEPQSKKKKRKKDKSAGLLYTLDKGNNNSTTKIVNLCQKTLSLNIQKRPNAPNQPNKSVNLSKNTAKNKANKGPNNKAKTIAQPPTKRSNLLLLANALKAKSSPSGSSHADKLKQMLR